MDYDSDYPQVAQAEGLQKLGNVSYRARLVQQSKELKQRAEDIDTIIAGFDKNPDLEKLLDAMRRLGV